MTEPLDIYGLRKCSTCRKALAFLDARGIDYRFHDLKDEPVRETDVAGWMTALGGWERLLNRAGYTWRGLPPADRTGLDNARAVGLALRHPSLIRRPLIRSAAGITVGFSAKVRSGLG
jgi:Spx/MgsR family transcriptional regulator